MSDKDIEKKPEDFLGHPLQIIPKFSNGFSFTALSNGQVIFTFTYKEGEQLPVLIDRVIVDREHAENIQKTLLDFLNNLDKKRCIH